MKRFNEEPDSTLDATPYLTCDVCGITRPEPEIELVHRIDANNEPYVQYYCDDEFEQDCIFKAALNLMEGRPMNHE